MKKLYKSLILPNEYVPSVHDVDYDEKIEFGIKYAIFDLDGTLVPFDSMKVDEKLTKFISQLNQKMHVGIYSDGSKERVKPVADILQVPYVYRAKKPFGKFKTIHEMFGNDCNPYNTMLIGNISNFDTVLANRLGMYNVLVDTLREHFNFKEAVCDMGQVIFTHPIKEEFQKYGHKK